MRRNPFFCALVTAAAAAVAAPGVPHQASVVAAQSATPSPYFGQPVPGLTPERFAPGVISTDAIELNAVFTPDLRELFFARRIDGINTMHHAVLVDGAWSAAAPLRLYPGEARAVAVDMAVSPDGRELYFLGIQPPLQGDRPRQPDIWRSRRVADAWTEAERLPAPINTDASEVYPTIVNDGSLYFTSNRPGGVGGNSLYRAQRLPDGGFASPTLVPAPVNSAFGVGDVYVSPDERYMVLSSSRPPSLGASDLFVSFRRADGAWSEPAHLGNAINTDQSDFCPMVTPDGRFFFFSRRRGASWNEATAGDVFWVDARILELFRR